MLSITAQQYVFPYSPQNTPANTRSERTPDVGGWRCALCNEEVVDVSDRDLWTDRDENGREFRGEETVTSYEDQYLANELTNLFQKYQQIYGTIVNSPDMQRYVQESGGEDFSRLLLSTGQNMTLKAAFEESIFVNIPMHAMNVSILPPRSTIADLKTGIDRMVSNYDYILQEVKAIVNAQHAKPQTRQREKPICDDCASDINDCYVCDKPIIPGVSDEEEIDDQFVCEDCAMDIGTCDHCDERILEGDDLVYYDSSETVDGWSGSVCRSCLENGEYTSCESCNQILFGNDDYGEYFTFTDGGVYCKECHNPEEIEWGGYEDTMKSEGLNKNEMLPIDAKDIKNAYLPFFQFIAKRGITDIDDMLSFAKKRNLRPEHLQMIEYLEREFINVPSVVQHLEKNLDAQQEFKKQYPGLKNAKNIPCDFKIKQSYGSPDVPSMTFTMDINSNLIDFANNMYPQAKGVWESMNRSPHHRGSLAYCRISEESEGDWVIDNLQSDADIQQLNDSYKTYMKGIQELRFIKKEGKWFEDKTKRKPGDQLIIPDTPENVDKRFVELPAKDEKFNINIYTQLETSAATAFWNKTFRHWPVVLLNMTMAMAKANNKRLYITSYAMQKNKWSSIPARSKDVYDKIPRQMGGEEVSWSGTPESLGHDNWQMVRVAGIFIKVAFTANLQNKLRIQQRMTMNQISAATNWFFTTGGTPQQLMEAVKNKQSLESLLLTHSDNMPLPNPKKWQYKY